MKTIEVTEKIYERLNEIREPNETDSEIIQALFHSIYDLDKAKEDLIRMNEDLLRMLSLAKDTIENQNKGFEKIQQLMGFKKR